MPLDHGQSSIRQAISIHLGLPTVEPKTFSVACSLSGQEVFVEKFSRAKKPQLNVQSGNVTRTSLRVTDTDVYLVH